MADKRFNELPNEITSPHDNDVLAVDKGSGSTSGDYTFRFTLGSLFTLFATRVMTLSNKSLLSPIILSGFTTNSTDKVTNLNSDRVDSCHVGPDAGDIPMLSDGPVEERLDLNFLGQDEGQYLTNVRGGVATVHLTGTLNLSIAQLGYVEVRATGNCTVNLPALTGSQAGVQVVIAHQSGAYNLAVNAASGQYITRCKDDLSIKENNTVSLNTVGASVILRYDGIGHWLAVSGRNYTGLE